MSEPEYRVVFEGKIKEDADLETVQKNLSMVFRSDMNKIRKLFSGKRSIIKKNAPLDVCEKMKLAFLKAGAICEIEEIITDETPPLQLEKDTKQEEIPKKTETPVNPYGAPRADVSPVNNFDESGFSGPQKVTAGNGAKWIATGFSLFKKNPFVWFFMLILYALIAVITQIIPFIGPIVFNLMAAVFSAGFIHGAQEQSKGNDLKIGHLFYGFSHNFGQLVLLSLLYFFAIIVIIAIPVGITIGFGFIGMDDPSNFANPSTVITMMVIMLAAFLVMIPILMAYWFAPALISVNNMPVMEAVKLSYTGCKMNMLPFLIYGLCGLGLSLIFIPIMFTFVGGGSLFGDTSPFLAFIPVILFIIIGVICVPTFMASVYASYEDIFYKK